MTATAVELANAAKTYPGSPPVEALKPTSLAIRRQESVAVVGPSGSGKSTLLSLMGTLDTPSSGDVIIGGQPTRNLNGRGRAALRSRQVGFVFQQFHLLKELSAVENVAMGLLYTADTRKRRKERSVEALRQVGLGGRANHRPAQLSGGEQQRVAIARALVREPAVLFADEPTGALDSQTSQEIVELLAQTTLLGAALVVVTHDLKVAGQFLRQLEVLDGVVKEKQQK